MGRTAMVAAMLGVSVLGASQAGAQQEPAPVFDGKTLKGWVPVGGAAENWKVVDGVLITEGRGGGWLSTEKTYANFVVDLEYRLQPGGNSGVNIRSPHQGNPAFVGMEIQILDDESPRYATLQPYQYCGSVYGVVPAKRGHTRPAGEWNHMQIRAEGSHIKVQLNGETIVDADLTEHRDAADAHPGILRSEGYIGLQSHSEPVEFRNIRIEELP